MSDIGAAVNVTGSLFVNNSGFSGGALATMIASYPSSVGPFPAFQLLVDGCEFSHNTAGPGFVGELRTILAPSGNVNVVLATFIVLECMWEVVTVLFCYATIFCF